MRYISTRGLDEGLDTQDAILQGIASDGGLLVPERFPRFTIEDLQSMIGMDYCDIASKILASLLDDFTPQQINEFVAAAYSEENFGEDPAPLIQLNKYNDREHILELWHGPTSAFKDIALQILPQFMVSAITKKSPGKKICVLTATSGDTGKAALEGFKDVEGTEVIVFYPLDGVSETQELQMITQEGNNCKVFGVKGSFDDAQAGVKKIFANRESAKKLSEAGISFSSANSINWGRLAPQIVYYFSSYISLLSKEIIAPDEKVNIVVPTGNFGNILSAWYAKKMGVPINKLICASNKNKILSDFFRNGVYNTNREFHKTNSPSMDILISSNLERLMFEITNRDHKKVHNWMESLSSTGKFSIDSSTLKKLQSTFVGGFAEDYGTVKTIRSVYDKYDHCVDTHTAVGFNVYERYLTRSGDPTKTIFVSTASPFKFPKSVCDAIFGDGYHKGRNNEVLLNELSKEIGMDIPFGLVNLSAKPVLHSTSVQKDAMNETVLNFLLKEK